MVERSLSMREVPGSIPGASRTFLLSSGFLGFLGKNKTCIVRESNPGRPRGRRAFYHWTNDALYMLLSIRFQVHQVQFQIFQKYPQSVGFEPTLPEGNWFLVSRLNHSATTAELQGTATSLGHIELFDNQLTGGVVQVRSDLVMSGHVLGGVQSIFLYQVFPPGNYSCPASSVGRAWDS